MPISPFVNRNAPHGSRSRGVSLSAVTYGGRAYSHGDPIYNATGAFVGNYIDGMTENDVAALLAYQAPTAAAFGGTEAAPVTPAPFTAAPSPAPAPAPAASGGARASTNPQLRDWIAANVNKPAVIYETLIVKMGMSVSQIDDVMAYPEGKSYGIAYIDKYFADNGINLSRWPAVRLKLARLATNPQANAGAIYQYVQGQKVTYAEMLAAAGWDKSTADAILTAGAAAVGAAGGGAAGGSFGGSAVMNPGGSASFHESTGGEDIPFDGPDYAPWLIGAGLLGALWWASSRGGRGTRRGRK